MNPYQLSVRVNPANPNHHLWNNNGTWFIHYVVHPTPFTKERIRRSLGTKSLEEARARRDEFLVGLPGSNPESSAPNQRSGGSKPDRSLAAGNHGEEQTPVRQCADSECTGQAFSCAG